MRWTSRLRNAVPTLILRSPLHGVLSRRMLELEFVGRRTGRRFRTPLAYARADDGWLVSTDSPWWRNLAAIPECTVHVAGSTQPMRATRIDDADEARAGLRTLVDAVPGYWRPAGIERREGRISDAALDRAIAGGRRVLRLLEVDDAR